MSGFKSSSRSETSALIKAQLSDHNNSSFAQRRQQLMNDNGANLNKKKIRVTEVIYEVQRRSNPLTSVYRGNNEWLLQSGRPSTREHLDATLGDGWKWLTDWKNDGSESWEYAPKFNSPTYSYTETIFDFVRRRRWYRIKVKTGFTSQELNELKLHKKEYVILGEEGDTLHTKIKDFQTELQNNLERLTLETQKPNILLLGSSGAGKSSLVNAVFGKPLAEIGEGKPITQNYTKYTSATSAVTIYDSKGIEHGNAETGFIADTKKFFAKLYAENSIQNQIHVVWYVIDLTQARFQPFEAEFCRNILTDIPIIFVFNKADAVTPVLKNTMIETVTKFNLQNCRGLFATVANCKNFDTKECPKCNSGKIRKRLKEGTCTIMCKECNETTVLTKTSGIEELKNATVSVLPDLMKDVFVVNYKIDMIKKEKEAKNIIVKFSEGASLTKSDNLSEKLVLMTIELAQLYGMLMVSDIAKTKVIQKFSTFYSSQKFLKKLTLFFSDFFSKKQTQGQALIVLTGLELCRTIIQFKRETILNAIGTGGTSTTNSPTALSIKKRWSDNFSEIQQQQASPDTVESTAEATNSNTLLPINNSADSSPSVEEEDPTDWITEKLLTNINLEVDGTLINSMSQKLRRFGSVQEYLRFVRIDGTNQYINVDKVIVAEDANKSAEDFTNYDMPIHNYQTHRQEPKPKEHTMDEALDRLDEQIRNT